MPLWPIRLARHRQRRLRLLLTKAITAETIVAPNKKKSRHGQQPPALHPRICFLWIQMMKMLLPPPKIQPLPQMTHFPLLGRLLPLLPNTPTSLAHEKWQLRLLQHHPPIRAVIVISYQRVLRPWKNACPNEAWRYPVGRLPLHWKHPCIMHNIATPCHVAISWRQPPVLRLLLRHRHNFVIVLCADLHLGIIIHNKNSDVHIWVRHR